MKSACKTKSFESFWDSLELFSNSEWNPLAMPQTLDREIFCFGHYFLWILPDYRQEING
jgi:hypothetical protein